MEFAIVLKQQVEDFFSVVVDDRDIFVSLGHPVSEGLGTNEEAFKDVDNFYLELRIRNLFIDDQENIKRIALVFSMDVVDLGG